MFEACLLLAKINKNSLTIKTVKRVVLATHFSKFRVKNKHKNWHNGQNDFLVKRN